MPIYEYECLVCKKGHEIMQKFNDPPLTACPDCGGEMKKLISNTSFVLKGTGWYKTDYSSGAETAAKETEKKTDTSPSPEKKTESKPEAA